MSVSRNSSFFYENGTDTLLPAESYTCSRLDQVVKLRVSKSSDLVKYPPLSVYSMFKRTASIRPNHDALVFKTSASDDWQRITYANYWRICNQAAKSFIKV